MLSTLSAGAAVASLLLAGSASPTTATRFGDDPPSGKITITVATVNGSGCRPGSAAVAIAPDNTAFTVTYSEYLAQAGAGSKPTDSRKNCQIALNVHVPQGFTYAIARADYRGYASLARGARGWSRRATTSRASSRRPVRATPSPVPTTPTGRPRTRPTSTRWCTPPVARSATSTSTPR